jgi:hypothetical protein
VPGLLFRLAVLWQEFLGQVIRPIAVRDTRYDIVEILNRYFAYVVGLGLGIPKHQDLRNFHKRRYDSAAPSAKKTNCIIANLATQPILTVVGFCELHCRSQLALKLISHQGTFTPSKTF